MFGKNAVVPQDLSSPHILRVKEIFYTIQGEGPNAGIPAVFIRMAGCNLQCFFCDTDFETDAFLASPSELVQSVRTLMMNGLVVISGGEPLIQDISELCRMLLSVGYHVQIETAGTTWVPGLAGLDIDIVCSPKTSKVHDEIAARCSSWKYLIRDGDQDSDDGLPNASTQVDGKAKRLYRPQRGTIYLQPLDEGSRDRNKLNMIAVVRTALRFGYRVSLQQHKIMGVE